MKWTRTLYERRKGRHLQASGSWKVTRQEDLIIKVVGLFFALSVMATLMSSMFGKTTILVPSLICLAISFVGMFGVLFGIAFLKAREEPLETHYYSDDYTYNGISGETVDNSREISAEEFLGKASADSDRDNPLAEAQDERR